jgi:hypothetical protein
MPQEEYDDRRETIGAIGRLGRAPEDRSLDQRAGQEHRRTALSFPSRSIRAGAPNIMSSDMTVWARLVMVPR